MVDRNNIQKIETKFSIDLLLFRHGKWHKNTDMVHFDSIFIVAGYSNDVRE